MHLSLSFKEWRNRARPLLSAGVTPETAVQVIAESGDAICASGEAMSQIALPVGLMRLLDSVSCFRADGRYELMYRLAWRTMFENRRLLEDAAGFRPIRWSLRTPTVSATRRAASDGAPPPYR